MESAQVYQSPSPPLCLMSFCDGGFPDRVLEEQMTQLWSPERWADAGHWSQRSSRGDEAQSVSVHLFSLYDDNFSISADLVCWRISRSYVFDWICNISCKVCTTDLSQLIYVLLHATIKCVVLGLWCSIWALNDNDRGRRSFRSRQSRNAPLNITTVFSEGEGAQTIIYYITTSLGDKETTRHWEISFPAPLILNWEERQKSWCSSKSFVYCEKAAKASSVFGSGFRLRTGCDLWQDAENLHVWSGGSNILKPHWMKEMDIIRKV